LVNRKFDMKLSGIDSEEEKGKGERSYRVDGTSSSRLYIQLLSPLTRICLSLGYVIDKYTKREATGTDTEAMAVEEKEMVEIGDWLDMDDVKEKTANNIQKTSTHQEKWWKEPPLQSVLIQKYCYSPIKECVVEKSVSFYGFVTFITEVKPCRGTHKWMRQFRLRDGSIQQEVDGLQVLIFGDDPKDFPNPSIGDVVRIHRAETEKYQDYIQCHLKFFKVLKDPSFIVVSRQFCLPNRHPHSNANPTCASNPKDSQSLNVYESLFDYLQNETNRTVFVKQVSHHNQYQWDQLVDPFVCCHLFRLFDEWKARNMPHTNESHVSTQTKDTDKSLHTSLAEKNWRGDTPRGKITLLQDLTLHRPRDNLVVLLVGKREVRINEKETLIWFVWDGTQSHYLYNHRPDLQGHSDIVDISCDLGAYVQITFLGKKSDSWIEMANKTAVVGSWVYLSNLQIFVQKDGSSDSVISHTPWTLGFDSSTHVRVVPPSSTHWVRERIELGVIFHASLIFMYIFANYYTPIASLKMIGQPNLVFKIRGYVVDYEPDVSSFVTTFESDSGTETTFLFALRIKDSSDTLRVVVSDENAERFLGVRVQDFDETAITQVTDRMNSLRTPGKLFDACIQTYLLQVDSSAHGFDSYHNITKLIGYQLIDTLLEDAQYNCCFKYKTSSWTRKLQHKIEKQEYQLIYLTSKIQNTNVKLFKKIYTITNKTYNIISKN
ncbi:hypothetical protein RFI_12272, partial [Reticulomyxa filosa]